MSREMILLVDDSEVARAVVGRMLERAGFSVETLESAFQLNRAIREHHPDLILLDVHMPALSGAKAASILGQYSFSKSIPVILHSEMEEDRLADLVRETGATGFIRKTQDGDELVDQVRQWLERSGQLSDESAAPPAAAPGPGP